MTIQTNCVQDYLDTHDLLPGQLFFKAYKALNGRDMSIEQQKAVCKDLGAYQVHTTIPDYVRRFCGGG